MGCSSYPTHPKRRLLAPKMPYTLNGIGTKYYGRREAGSDGSYVTTEWIVLLYLPLIPIGSFRVCPTGKSTNAIVYNSQQFMVRRMPFNWPQIRNIYGVTGAIAATLIGGFTLFNYLENKNASPTSALPTTTLAQLSPIQADT